MEGIQSEFEIRHVSESIGLPFECLEFSVHPPSAVPQEMRRKQWFGDSRLVCMIVVGSFLLVSWVADEALPARRQAPATLYR
jgi:hypothetical protein